jgi:hypothetical protein
MYKDEDLILSQIVIDYFRDRISQEDFMDHVQEYSFSKYNRYRG